MHIITDPTEQAQAVREHHIAHQIGSELQKHYPNRNWMVQCNMQTGVVDIICPDIAPNYGYMLHINQPSITLRAKAKQAGGELLERFGLSRSKNNDGADIQGLSKNKMGVTEGLADGGI